jgi:GAF domain-containing protein
MLQQGGFAEEQLRMLRQLGMKSVLIVPLISREVPLGALTLMTAESGRTLTGEDLEIAQSLATRAAIAIDNARLYEATANARAEAQLREEELRLVQESAKVASWSYDLDKQQFALSEHAGQLLGRGPGVYTMKFDEFNSILFFSTDQQRFRQVFAALEKGKKEVDLQFRVASGRRSAKLLAMRGKLFFNFGQSRALGVLIDITASQDEKLQQRRTTKAGVTHRSRE